jgi:ribosome-associated translation inhibitor RaiA
MNTRMIERGDAVSAPLLPQFPTHIRGREGDFGPAERAHVRHKLARRFNKFADSIERVSLRTEDVNGPRGGVDRICRIKVVLRGVPSIVIEKQDAFLNTAVDLALFGAARAVRRALQRRRMKPLRRTH